MPTYKDLLLRIDLFPKVENDFAIKRSSSALSISVFSFLPFLSLIDRLFCHYYSHYRRILWIYLNSTSITFFYLLQVSTLQFDTFPPGEDEHLPVNLDMTFPGMKCGGK